MTRTFSRLALAGLALTALLSACDSKPAAPVEPAAAPVAATPPPPPPLDVATAMAAVDQKTLCNLFARASSDAKVHVTGGDCVVTPGATDIAIATKDGKSKLTVPLVEAGAAVQLTPALVSTQSVADAKTGGFSNVGVVFIGRAPASGLCMALEYAAADGTSNSVFVASDPTVKGATFEVNKTAGAVGVAAYAEPVVKAGAIGAFAVSRREAGLVVKSATFKAC